MTSDVASLPREPDILIGMITELRDENDKLRAMLATLKRTLFGARSEKFDAGAGQLPLELEDLSTASTEPEAAASQKDGIGLSIGTQTGPPIGVQKGPFRCGLP